MAPDLVRPVERRQEHRVAERVQRGQRLAILDHDLADGGQPVVLEHGLQEVERLPADLVGLQVVGALDEPHGGVVALGLRELLDLDGADRLEGDVLEVLVGDHDVLAGRVLVALDRVAAGDRLILDGAPDLHLDARQVRLVEHVEADALGLGREIELDRDGDQSELDGPLPHRTRHADPHWCSSAPAGTPGPGRRDGHHSAPGQTPTLRGPSSARRTHQDGREEWPTRRSTRT